MKKIISAFICLMLILGFSLISVSADGSKSKTQNFIDEIPKGVGVKIQDTAEVYIKDNKASVNITIPGVNINAKAILSNGKIVAYLFGFCKADVTDIVKEYISVEDITTMINEIPKAFSELDTDEVFEYLILDSENSTETKEIFIPNREKIKEYAVEAINGQLDIDVSDKTLDEIIEYAVDRNIDVTPINNLLNSKAVFKYEGKKMTSAVVSFPSDESFRNMQTVDLFKTIGIEFITIDVSDDLFKAPFAIMNVTWLVKLIYKMVINKVG